MHILERIDNLLASETVNVGDTILRALGATSWTGVSSGVATQRGYLVCNHSGTRNLYYKLIARDGALGTAVSSVKADGVIPPMGSAQILVGRDVDVALVKDGGATAEAVTVTRIG
jgi:hypothetical protein